MSREGVRATALPFSLKLGAFAMFNRIATLFLFLCLIGASNAQEVTKLCAQGQNALGQQTCATILQPTVSAAVESSHTFKVGAATAIDFQVNSGASALWIMLFDSSTVPTNGTVSGCANQAAARPCIAKWYQVAANSTIGVTWSPGPFLALQTGQVVVCSTTGPFTLTLSSTCVISGEGM